MKMTSRIGIAIAAALAMTLTACDNGKLQTPTIPAAETVSIDDAAKTLNVSSEAFSSYLDTMELTYDEFITDLNNKNVSLSDLKSDIEKQFDCSYDEYIKTVIAVTNKTVPDSDYAIFSSKYSAYNAYIPVNALNESKDLLTNGNIKITVADENEDAYAFDVIAGCNNDFTTYMTVLNDVYDCSSAELTNMTLFGGRGVTKPDGENACMDSLFVYDEQTNEILETIVIPVLTLHNEDESKNITLALSNELGLIFRTDGSDSFERMLKLSSLDFQIRNAELNKTSEKSDENQSTERN